ncbi:peptidylglycine alpha-hydroxylating monooxygenase-like [Haliotis rufescens]|uniref:peptidylglycine alpha-hydroxylating monooxygenase-like n=1 Tax=Haliotis rufescens TaxID=6454 RepID=UPI00201F61B9|nr:peptidylglycine alpha-hydroxylating monooxygenase-like [Haliotis rufescens]XP_046357219.2 peptidylglycine alpha-hydroxylating monooxygenase-like [Haliotis rufescens]XP_048252177.1 peptidylglycine alpha-hydroxylating monooxygenase-like [Haliotis rufescens]
MDFINTFLEVFPLVCTVLYVDGGKLEDPSAFTRTIRMPHVRAEEADALLCHAVRLNRRTAYIVKYDPHASRTRAHHLMVYGCKVPGSTRPYWSCGETSDRSERSVCSDGDRQVVFAWALDAPSMNLPEGVGFRVGGDTGIDYIVIQLHYVQRFPGYLTDDSGVTLHMTYTPQPKQAGFYVLADTGYIPPQMQEFHMESACDYDSYSIFPIGYRTHSHNLGLVTSGYRIRDGHWTELGRMSPQLPQTFYNVTTPNISIRRGDILAARCTMNSMQREEYTMIGATNTDEMCNFYILYYTYRKENLKVQYCFRNAQHFKWADYLETIPDSASSLAGIPNSDAIRDKFRPRLPRMRGRRNHATM